jgi:monoamine oxidase
MVNRRQFLLASLAAPALMGTQARSARPRRTIIIIGAGISGLAAARHLKVQGQEVIVLEARDRIGGRLLTSRSWADLPVDLGASWIHGTTGNPLTAIAQQAGLTRVATSYDRSELHIDPALRAMGVSETDRDWAENLVERALERAARAPSDISLRAAIDAISPPARRSPSQAANLAFHLAGAFEQEYSGSAERISAKTIEESREFGGDDVLFPGGYDAVVQHLAQGLDIRRNCRVNKIETLSNGVKIHCKDGRVLAGDHTLVTVPLGVLKAGHIQFSTALPSEQARAIRGLEMGLLNKHFLRFERNFWPKEADWHELLKPDPGKWSQWVSFARAAGKPVLLGFAGADTARTLERLDDRAILSDAMASVRAMFGSSVPDPIGYQFTRWSQDDLTLGSYSFNTVGSGPDDRHALARLQRDARLSFAGEACSADYPGTVHGAYLSGVDAARAILRR